MLTNKQQASEPASGNLNVHCISTTPLLRTFQRTLQACKKHMLFWLSLAIFLTIITDKQRTQIENGSESTMKPRKIQCFGVKVDDYRRDWLLVPRYFCSHIILVLHQNNSYYNVFANIVICYRCQGLQFCWIWVLH